MNPTLETIHALRTVHGDFDEREVSDEALETILDAAVRAANSSCRQVYAIIVVSDREVMKKLCGYRGSRLLVFCVDFNRLRDQAKHLDFDYDNGKVIPFVTGCVDTVLAAQTACIAAKSLGIDSLFTNGIHRGDPRRVYEILKLPHELCFPLVALVLGYPKSEPRVKKGRLRGVGIVHRETYQRLTPADLDKLVATYDDPKQHLALESKWREKGCAHYLEWFYSHWHSAPKMGKGTPAQVVQELLQSGGFF